MLADQTGMGHELYYYTASPAIVLVSSADGDAVSARAATALAKVRDAFKGKNVQFLMLDSSLNSPHGKFVGTPGSADLPVLADELQLVGRALGVTTTAEVFLVETKTWTLAYHGPIDDSFAQKKNKKATLTAALNAVLDGKPVPVAEAAVKGTPVDFPDRQHVAEFAKIDYATQVAPILADKCVTCHTQGGLGPFAMNSYDVVKGFAPMIREVLRTKRMPPYHSDSHGATWTDDMRLTDAQVKTIVNWVEAGAPRGEGAGPAAGRGQAGAEVAARRARRGRADSGVRRAGNRHRRLPGSLDPDAAHRRQVAAGHGVGQRDADRASRARRLDSESRSERPRLLVERRARRLRPGRRAEPDAGRHRHLPAAGRLVRLSDALHADRQAGHRQDRGRLLLLQGRAEVHPAPGFDHRFLDRDPGRRGASPGNGVYRVPARRGSVRRAAALPFALLLDQAAHPLSGRHREGAAEPAALLLLVAARVSLPGPARSAEGLAADRRLRLRQLDGERSRIRIRTST